jgi:hypothetical protein
MRRKITTYKTIVKGRALMNMRYSFVNTSIVLAIAFVTFSACDRKEELPTNPPMPSTTSQTNPRVSQALSASNNPAGFNGFGPAKFGSDEESVRMSWGRPLNASNPAKGMSCYYLYSDSMPQQRGIAFMLEEGRFVRYDVHDARQKAPGNIVVGDTTAAVMQAYAGRVHNQPHKYIDGAHTLIVTPPQATEAKLVFETDANDRIVEWRIGVPPQVYYVEGCG